VAFLKRFDKFAHPLIGIAICLLQSPEPHLHCQGRGGAGIFIAGEPCHLANLLSLARNPRRPPGKDIAAGAITLTY